MFKRTGNPSAPPAPAQLAPGGPAPARATTYFDATSELSGSLKLHKDVHIDGSVEGEIECDATVSIGPSAKVNANVKAEMVVIDGEVHGDIEARGEITLRKGARVFGDMATEGIVIERGAKVEGRITIGPVGGAKAAGKPAAPHSGAPAAHGDALTRPLAGPGGAPGSKP